MKKLLLFTFVISSSLLSIAQSFTLVKPDPASTTFNSNSITDLMIDNNNVICYTRGDSALAIYDGVNWTYKGYTALGFSGNKSPSKELDKAPNGDYWLACFSGLDIINGNTVTIMNVANSELKNDFFTDLSIDNNGLTFIGYGNGFGLSMIENGNWTHKGNFTGSLSPFNSISAANFIEVNKQTNDTWIISGDNFYKLNNGSLTTYTSSNTDIPYFSSSNVTGMTITDDGKVWFSLESNSNDPTVGGLLSFDGITWVHYNTNNSDIPSNNITAITSYKNQIIFNHYSVSGISVFDGTNWVLYDGTNGSNYPVNANYTVHEMKANNNKVYMGTNSGLFIMELPEIVDVNESLKNSILIYPNPSGSEVSIETDMEGLNIELKNYLGVIVKKSSLINNKLNISTLPNGVYFVSFFNQGNLISTSKLIKK